MEELLHCKAQQIYLAKDSSIFAQNTFEKFTVSLTNNIVSFEQSGPEDVPKSFKQSGPEDIPKPLISVFQFSEDLFKNGC